MKRIIILLLLGCTVLAGASAAKINLPAAKELTFDNGLTAVVIERHALPLFSVSVIFRAGSIYDPDGRDGLASITNDLIMRGTTTRSAKDIADEISFGGGQLDTYCDHEDAGLSGEFMPEYANTCFELIGDMLLNSQFAKDELQKSKDQANGYLAGRFDDPSTLANELIYKQILGGNPYAHNPMGTVDDIDSITRPDVTDFFARYYTPANCRIIVCGDVNTDSVRARISRYLGSWAGGDGIVADTTHFETAPETQILLIDKPDATQAQIRVGNLGMARTSSDYVPFELARTIFAGSFMSRLMTEIRVNRGLTYSVRYRANYFEPGGLDYVSTFTQNETVGEVIDIIMKESNRMRTEPVSDSELTGAINYRSGLYPLDFETNGDLVTVFTNMWLYGLDRSAYEDFPERLATMTADDVTAEARKYFPDKQSRMVVIGVAKTIESQLQKFGEVKVVELDSL
jgi:zinc protease